jgi:hypothetical protein
MPQLSAKMTGESGVAPLFPTSCHTYPCDHTRGESRLRLPKPSRN